MRNNKENKINQKKKKLECVLSGKCCMTTRLTNNNIQGQPVQEGSKKLQQGAVKSLHSLEF